MDMKKICLMWIFLLFCFSCIAQEINNLNRNEVIISDNIFLLGESTFDELSFKLGEPHRIEYFEKGGEGFYWKDFYVVYYDNDLLYFHFSKDNELIRMTINRNSIFRVDSFLGSTEILKKIDIEDKCRNLNIDIKRNTESFMLFNLEIRGNVAPFAIWFSKDSKIEWIDFYVMNDWNE